MNEKEFNLQVLAKLVEIANVIFAKLTINIEGTFTAAELWEGKNSLNENIVIDYHGTQFDTYTVEVGTFKCSFTPEKVFYLVWKFEQLCRVRQENKARFTYGVEKREIVTGKAMYIGKGGKVMKRKKTLVRLSEHVAYEPCKQSDSVDMYYFAGGIWYYVQRAYSESQLDRMANKLENDTEWLKNTLNGMDYTQDIAINTIYKALRDVLCAEVIKDTSKERKCENEAENVVFCDIVTGSNNCNSLHVEQREVKAKIVSMIEEGGICTESAKILYEKLTGHKFGEPAKVEPTQEEAHEVILTYFSVVVDGDAFEIRIKPEKLDEPYRFECTFAECVAKMRHTNPDVRDAAKEEIVNRIYNCVHDHLRKERGLCRVIPICNKAVDEFIRINGIGKQDDEPHEDYPPEPYNKEKSENIASLATIKTRNVATSYERFQDRTICGRFQKNMCPNYLRQKVFPTESFQSRRKIRRYKPFSCLRYTNYHPIGESAANQTEMGKSGGYSVVTIRGSAERKGKFNSLSP